MSVARTWSVALVGLQGTVVEVEADLSKQLPDFRIIGLPDKSLGEAVQRVHNACANCGLTLPRRRITVNLSPASLPKHGSGFDVAIAVAALATDGLLDLESVSRTAHLGELGLDGRLRPVPGVLPAVVAAAKARIPQVVVPDVNRAEAELVSGIRVVAASNLAEVARLHGADVDEPDLPRTTAVPEPEQRVTPLDLADVLGQREAVDALVVRPRARTTSSARCRGRLSTTRPPCTATRRSSGGAWSNRVTASRGLSWADSEPRRPCGR